MYLSLNLSSYNVERSLIRELLVHNGFTPDGYLMAIGSTQRM